MITVRPSQERGRANPGWLDSRFSFSFAEYHDPRHMGFRNLRVINDDLIAGNTGFPMHPHHDMEIVTYMLEGAIAHRDSMGNGSTIRAGEVQRMTAGTGILHSEYNPGGETTRLLQIWIRPRTKGLPPSYEQKPCPPESKRGTLRPIATADGRDGSMRIETDASVFASILDSDSVTYELAPDRHAWIQVAYGDIAVNGTALTDGDGAAISGESRLAISGAGEFLLFDLA